MTHRLVRFQLKLLLLLLGVPLHTLPQGLIVEPADVIVVHGRVYTQDPKQPWAQAVAIRGARIVAVGDDTTIEKRRGMGTKVVNAGGKLVLPGLVDCHVHLLSGSLGLAQVDLTGTTSKPGPEPTRIDKLLALRAGMKWANELGITRVHSVGGDFEILDLFDEMRRRGDLHLRLYVAYALHPPQLSQSDLDVIEVAHKKYHDEWIDAGAVNLVLDGEPYNEGKPLGDSAGYAAAVSELDKRGFQLFTQAIGDDAVRMALDAYERAAQRNRKRDRRPRIENMASLASPDIPRFGKLGVIASMQPLHASPSADTSNPLPRESGPDHSSQSPGWKSIWNAGGRLAFGSDWPAAALNPWEGIQAAVTQGLPQEAPRGRLAPEQRLSVEQAVEAYTQGAAFAGRREKTEGSLEEGKLADLIIVSQNIFDIDPRKIGATKVITTILGGHIVYQAEKK